MNGENVACCGNTYCKGRSASMKCTGSISPAEQSSKIRNKSEVFRFSDGNVQ